MAGVGDEDEGATLDARAGPVRTWLTQFFRRRVRNAADVEDMVQDVFLRIASRDSTDTIDHLDGYVLRTASSVLTDRIRRRSSRREDLHVAFDAETHGGAELDPGRILSGKQDLNAALKALLTLPERTRVVFLLRRLEGYKVRDIATRLGVSVSAVEKHLVRAVQHLQAEMADYLHTEAPNPCGS
jgi:RNA polymerase sigma factor (sigma-70 family)